MDAITSWFIGLFSQNEWRAFIWLILATMAATHTIKVSWRLSPFKGGGHGQIYLISAVAALWLAYFIWPSNGIGLWWIAGLMASPAANLAFKLGFGILKRYMPDLAATVNLDRRKVWGLPPEGRGPRRKEDL